MIPFPEDGTWVDMGGGTGSNLEFFADRIHNLKNVYVVDLSSSLLKIAEQRFQEKEWSHAHAVEADATTWQPEGEGVDVVTFSYSLTMIPDWFSAMENALRMLKPGGVIAVVDFYVSRKYPVDGLKKHNWFTRHFWPTWFSSDNVFPSPDHLPFLRSHTETVELQEHRAKVPYIPFIRTAYYQFIGRKKQQGLSESDCE